jgi:hypothetical protein
VPGSFLRVRELAPDFNDVPRSPLAEPPDFSGVFGQDGIAAP